MLLLYLHHISFFFCGVDGDHRCRKDQSVKEIVYYETGAKNRLWQLFLTCRVAAAPQAAVAIL